MPVKCPLNDGHSMDSQRHSVDTRQTLGTLQSMGLVVYGSPCGKIEDSCSLACDNGLFEDNNICNSGDVALLSYEVVFEISRQN